MARLINIEPTANGTEQDARWKRKAAERINALLGEVDRLSDAVDALRARADASDTRMNAFEIRIKAVEDKQAADSNRIDDHETRIYKLEHPSP